MERVYWGTPLGRREWRAVAAVTAEEPAPRVALVGFGPVFEFGRRFGWFPGAWRETDPDGPWDFAVVLERRSLPEVAAFHAKQHPNGWGGTTGTERVLEVHVAQPFAGSVLVAGVWRRGAGVRGEGGRPGRSPSPAESFPKDG
jgi:hypothetical protein